MKFGLALPYNQARAIPEWAHLAEKQGWDGIFLGDAIWCEDPMITLAAAAAASTRIRLGTMIVPVPLRRPWKLASEALALDRLSGGRVILGIGTGAVWMGWESFPDEVTDPKTRIAMLDETIELLTRLFQREPFDFEGTQYHLKLSLLDQIHYPPKPIQQPRIPLWTPAVWPREKSMQRALNCDGVIVEMRDADNRASGPTPEDIQKVKAYVRQHRSPSNPFDIVVDGKTLHLDDAQRGDKLAQLKDAGATWWIEDLWNEPPEVVSECIHRGPPTKID